MRSLFVAALVAAAVAAAPVAAAELVREARPLSGFSRIEIDGQADVTLRQGTSEGVTIEAPAQMMSRIRTEIRDRTLIVTPEGQHHWWDWVMAGGSTRSPRISIDFIRLERIDAAGAVKLSADTIKADDLRLDLAGACTLRVADLQAARLRLDGSGAVKAELSGKVVTQYVDLSGAGSYQAAELASDNAVLRVSGAGKAMVNVATKLKVEVAGAGKVDYIGDPTVEQQVSGVAKITRREAR
ncbi:MAG TPA: head GIN domain-containing protein [Casimicrobiaceae bacterium]|nr:head GIN domain-containing protein [Casimicrobiaceae bacterium]